MKKIVVLLFVAVIAMSAKAQVYVGGNVSLWHNDDADNTFFAIAPEVGYNFSEKWAVGASLGFVHNSNKLADFKNAFYFAPYARYSFYENKVVRLFVDGTIGVSSVKYEVGGSNGGFELGVKPGIAIKLNNHFSLIGKCGFLGYRDDYAFGEQGYGFSFSSEDLSLGFHYEF